MKRNHSTILKASLSNPEIRQKISIGLKEALRSPEARQRKRNTANEMWQRPGERERRSKISREALSRPSFKAARAATEERIKEKRRQITLEQFADPTARDKHSQITQSLFADLDYRERHKAAHNTPEYKAKMDTIRTRTAAQRSAILSKKRWITDGSENRFVDPDTPMPEGWSYGRVRTPALLASLVKARKVRHEGIEKGV